MPKRHASEHSTSYAERYADEAVSDSKQSNFALDHPPDDWRQTDFAHRFTDELKAHKRLRGRGRLHALADPLPADVEEGPVPFPAGARLQVRQLLHQVGGHRHIAAPLCIVARYVGPQAEDGRVPVEPEVRGPEGETLGHPVRLGMKPPELQRCRLPTLTCPLPGCLIDWFPPISSRSGENHR